MKRRIISILISSVLIISLLSCISDTVEPALPLSLNRYNENEIISIYLPLPYDVSMDYMTMVAQQAGFPLEFKPTGIISSGFDLIEYIDNSYGNAIFVIGMTEDIRDNNVNIYDLFESILYHVTNNAKIINEADTGDNIYIVSSDATTGFLGFRIYIHNDYINEINKPDTLPFIINIEEYYLLLQRLNNKYPDKIPGATSLQYYDEILPRGNNIALQLFLPEMGYTPINHLFPFHKDLGSGLWVDKNGKILSFYDIDASIHAFNELLHWNNEGLMDFEIDYENFDNYMTIIMPVDIGIWHPPKFDFIDQLFNESINFFLRSETIVNNLVNTIAYAIPGSDTGEFQRFLNWLSVPENYINFYFGMEGIDYEYSKAIDFRNINESLGFDNNKNYRSVNELETDFSKSEAKEFFKNSTFNNVLINNTFKRQHLVYIEFPEAITMSLPELQFDLLTRFMIGEHLADDLEYVDFLSDIDNSMSALVQNLYKDDFLHMASISEDITLTIQALRNHRKSQTVVESIHKALYK